MEGWREGGRDPILSDGGMEGGREGSKLNHYCMAYPNLGP